MRISPCLCPPPCPHNSFFLFLHSVSHASFSPPETRHPLPGRGQTGVTKSHKRVATTPRGCPGGPLGHGQQLMSGVTRHVTWASGHHIPNMLAKQRLWPFEMISNFLLNCHLSPGQRVAFLFHRLRAEMYPRRKAALLTPLAFVSPNPEPSSWAELEEEAEGL